ncbi:hypothetical protein D9E92_21110 [Escherichia coli]|nr:hypothetical protein [Salmonella enterica]EBX6305085.1 hypothetical protein [Salmonella enterica subsp. enterica serovar Enugu]EBX6964703.1 hypothetical protein [Salmonella enterica subsp. enterica serovar Typhimurium]EBY0587078.1 hypothetical protein [Salmonella enterica subsp. enterica serovar Glostrup]ECN6697688.1 hypothetical protein [Salmonella enterica subsp. enterica serovar Heidelberg]EDU1712425.1 hypothetical protein [Salmonella enterica subsp. enterica serovar Javiana]EEW1483193.
MWPVSDEKVGVLPTRVYPQSGRISALAGRQGRLRACMRNVQEKEYIKAYRTISLLQAPS